MRVEGTRRRNSKFDKELEQIVADLDVELNVLPEDALRAAQRRRADIVPYLVSLIEKANLSALTGVSTTGNGHFFALFLLTEFQAKEALPAILDVLRLPGVTAYELYGDAITECHALTHLAVDSPVVIDNLISDRSIDEFVRWEAAQTLIYWVRDGHMTRDEAVQRLSFHLHEAIADHDTKGATPLVIELLKLAPHEAIETINEAFDRGLIDLDIVDRDCVRASLSDPESSLRKIFDSLQDASTTDSVELLKQWSCFRHSVDTKTSTESASAMSG